MNVTIKLGGRTTYCLASTYGDGAFVHLSGYAVKASADPKEAAAAVLAHRTLGDWASAVKRPALVNGAGEIFRLTDDLMTEAIAEARRGNILHEAR